MPREMRLLGDEYIKAEFRAHRNVENPVHIVRFLGSSSGRIEWRRWKGWELGSKANWLDRLDS